MNIEELKEQARLTDEELPHLNEQWELEYEDEEMTDAEWELKRWGLIAEAQIDKLLNQPGVCLKIEKPSPENPYPEGHWKYDFWKEVQVAILQWIEESYIPTGETQ